MKKYLTFMKACTFVLASALMIGFISCSEDDEDKINEILDSIVNFEGQTATYNAGDMPSATGDTQLGYVEMNTQALAGGASFITINSQEDFKAFYVALLGQQGYFRVTPKSKTIDEHTHTYTYTMVMNFSPDFNANVVVVISGVTRNGEVSLPQETVIEFVESQTADLDIKLVFENAKDVDLHLYTPSGQHIYYGDRGGTYTDDQDSLRTYGLDHDSNAGCRIDNLNNENIFIPTAMLEAGTYTVEVNMYSNCDRTISTSWKLWVRFGGQLIRNELEHGSNPAEGVYPVDADEGDHTEVFKFTLSERQVGAARIKAACLPNFRPIPPTEMDLIKMEQEAIDATL
ncbi:MAG: hypothetical protein MR505_03270 [Bacteroidales bacterium]|nr:hypothetical protein [Bacteroidales bacterium]